MLIMKSSVFVREVSGIWQVHIAAVCILDRIFAIVPIIVTDSHGDRKCKNYQPLSLESYTSMMMMLR